MPRAAMSVAMSVRSLPLRKSASTRSRWFCDLLPWIASAACAGLLQAAHDLVGAVLGAGEHQHAVDRFALEQFGEQRRLGGLLGVDHALGDALDGRGLRRHRHPCRVAQHLVGELGDFLRHGGREEQRLPFFRHHGDDPLDVVDEAHVEHAVGFVEHQHLDLVEAHGALIDEVEQAAGRRDQHFGATRHAADLPVDRHAADRQLDGQRADMPAVGAEAVGDLAGELARRRQHQHAARLTLGAHALVGEVVEDRQREGRGLAGAGLGDADDVAALEGERNGLGLDRGGGLVFFFGDGAKDRLCEAEVVKRSQRVSFL